MVNGLSFDGEVHLFAGRSRRAYSNPHETPIPHTFCVVYLNAGDGMRDSYDWAGYEQLVSRTGRRLPTDALPTVGTNAASRPVTDELFEPTESAR
jgi:hypothetical protein